MWGYCSVIQMLQGMCHSVTVYFGYFVSVSTLWLITYIFNNGEKYCLQKLGETGFSKGAIYFLPKNENFCGYKTNNFYAIKGSFELIQRFICTRTPLNFPILKSTILEISLKRPFMLFKLWNDRPLYGVLCDSVCEYQSWLDG